MVKRNSLTKIIITIIILLVATIGTLSASRTISSKTIHIYGYVPSYTAVEVLENGQINFTSNNSSASIDVIQQNNETTLLTVVAR